ncbi:unnamed protein product [Somion occarium]|uniref:Fungal-type protein kinase domain-containing protein n=1 Tax=Somion occarium TaxID=3059160 RepID=A0ABP1DRQ9_9APHY
MYGMSIGPMPIGTFLQEYFPIGERYPASRSSDHAFDKLPTNPTREQQMYQPFVDIMNRRRKLCGKLKFRDTGDKRDADVDTNMRPDIVSYWGDDPPMDLDWSLVEIIVEWKLPVSRDGYSDSFKDGKLFVENAGSQKAKATRGQLFSYAAIQMTHQHRLFVYLVGIYGSYARLYRVDRSCIVASAPFNYMVKPHVLLEFFWRYSRMHAVQRGYDPTVSLAEDAECQLFDSKIKEYLERAKRRNYRTYPGIEGMADGDYATCKIQVNDRNGGVSHWIVRKPLAQPELLTPCGRCTRGYIAIRAPGCDAENEASEVENQAANTGDECELYWMKDSWRTAEYEQEADIYAELKDAEVPHIPVIHCAGDVLADTTVQRTTNQLWLKKPEAKKWRRPTGSIKNLVHHRVVQELLYPLHCVRSAKELVHAMRDASEAIVMSYYDAKRLHRDISKGNVMLTENPADDKKPCGILNDWDHSRPLKATTPVFNHRTGTWQFMSVALLKDPEKPHEVFDDIESILWVMLFISIHHFKHTGKFSMDVFDQWSDDVGGFAGAQAIGGENKQSWLFARGAEFDCPALQKVIKTMSKFHQHFRQLVVDSQERDGDKKPLQEYREELEKDLRRVYKHFDDQLNNPSADWTDGNPVEDIYPPQKAADKDKKLMASKHASADYRSAMEEAENREEGEITEVEEEEEEQKKEEEEEEEEEKEESMRKTRASAKTEKGKGRSNDGNNDEDREEDKGKGRGGRKGKSKAKDKSGNIKGSKTTSSRISSSTRARKRRRDDIESEDEEPASSRVRLSDIPEEEEGDNDVGPSKRRCSMRLATKRRPKKTRRAP